MTTPRNYYRPQTLKDALQLAGQPDTVALAGGAVTLDALDVPFGTFVDLQDIPELKKIEATPGGYVIGGAVTLQQIVDLPDLHPVIRRSLTRSITLNHRHGTSVAESLLRSERFPEWIAVLTALYAGIEQIYPDGRPETRPVSDGLPEWGKETPGMGIITALMVNANPPLLGASFVARTPADAPIVCAAVHIHVGADARMESVFLAVCGITPQPVRIEVKADLTENALHAFVDNLELEVTYSDYRGSAEYRAATAKVCLKRALSECWEQVKHG